MKNPDMFLLVALTLLFIAPVDTAPHHVRAKKHSPHEFVYVNCGAIQQFRVGEDGGLVPLNPAAVPGGSGSAYVFVDSSHRYAYALDNDHATVYQYRIRHDGTLATLIPPTVLAGRDPEYMTFSPNGRAAYVANLLSNTISQYHIAADGAMEPMRPSQVPGGDIMNAPCLPAHRHFAYAPGRGGVAQFAVRPNGSLRPLSPQIIPVPRNAERIVCDPTGRFIYTSGVGQGGIRQYRIRADGQLIPMAQAVFSLPYPAYFAEGDAPPGYLYASVVGIGIAQLRFGTNGQLALVKPIVRYPTTGLTFSQGGHFAYSAGDDDLLRSFKVGEDGALTQVGSPLPVPPRAGTPAVVPSGRFVYVPDWDSGKIFQFRVSTDGSLVPLSLPSISVNGRPASLTTLRLP